MLKAPEFNVVSSHFRQQAHECVISILLAGRSVRRRRFQGAALATKDIKARLDFVRLEPYVVPKKSLTGDSSERVDTRVLQVIFAFERGDLPIFVGQQMDVFIDAPDRNLTAAATKGGRP